MDTMILVMWLSLFYANGVMYMSGLTGFARYHGFLILLVSMVVVCIMGFRDGARR